jgi:energy-coupling factor transporter ATP-binding protein EcfA2
VPRGRVVEVFGPESSGKTTLVYHVLAQAQKLGGVCAFIDAEHSMDPLYAREIGVDIDELLLSQPDYGEQALEVADVLVRSGAVDVVAIDSVAALTPRKELEGQMGDQMVGAQARMMSQAMRKLAGNLNRTQTLCLLTNQIREKVGVVYGSPETQPVRYSVLSKSGAHYSYGQQRIGQGREQAKAFLEENPTIAAEIEAGIYTATGIAAERTGPITHPGTPNGAHPEGHRQAGERDRDDTRDRDETQSLPVPGEPLAVAA